MKTLVVYFSRKGYTKKVALQAAEKLGADIFELKTAQPTGGIPGFWWCGRFGMHRWGMPVEQLPDNLFQYDRVVLCSPVWVFTVSAPMLDFVTRCSGQIKEVEYILVHFSFPMKYPHTVAKLDRILGVNHRRFVSVACQWGRFYRERVVDESEA